MGRSVRWTVVAAAVALIAAAPLAGCAGSDGAEPGGDGRYLVIPESTPGFAIGQDDEGYASGVRRDDGSTIGALVRPLTEPGGWDEITAGATASTLANGLEVFYVCGGGGSTPEDGAERTRFGPLMVVAQVDGGVLTVEETPTDTSRCEQPTALEGPLVDLAASLQWVDGPEFRRLLEAHPAPEREPTPPTTR